MTISFPFEQQFTWRQLGYLYFQDSLDYREVLTQNPEWNVTELPPIGAQLRLSPSANSVGTPGGLTQGSFITGLAPQSTNNDFSLTTPRKSTTKLCTAILCKEFLNGKLSMD